MTRQIALSLALIVSGTFLFSQEQTNMCYTPDPGGMVREHNMDFISLDLFVQFQPKQKHVTGTATYSLRALQTEADSVFLDGPGILVNSVALDEHATGFRMDSAGITIYFDPPLLRGVEHTLKLEYDAYPKRGIYFNGWDQQRADDPNDPTIIRKQIWTQGQGIDNRHWIPCYDGLNDKLITSLHVEFDTGYTVVSNGVMRDVSKLNDGKVIWHYAMRNPHPPYLIMLAIGKYDTLQYSAKNGITTTQYYYPGTRHYAENTYRYTTELMEWMAEEIDVQYPWETYANVPVQEFLYGAMENTTATIFSDLFYQSPASNPDKQYIEINAHELTHQWFGDYVTAWSGDSHWLQESFATYYSKKFAEHIYGDDYYQWKRREEMLTAINADNQAAIPVGHSQAGSALVYQKGSFVLDMLRYVVGDAAFRIAIRDFLLRHPYDNVRSGDLEMQFMRSLGLNVHTFFDQWIYRNGYPVYWVKWESAEKETRVHVVQAQDKTATTGLFSMPVHVQVHYKDGSFDDRLIEIAEDSTTIIFQNGQNKEPVFVLFDPNHMVLSSIAFEKPYTELRYQAYNAPNMMDRYDAIAAMRETEIETKREDLIALFRREKFYGLKNEIIYQLADDDSKASIALLKEALQDTHPLVRRSVLQALDTLPPKLKDAVTALLRDDNYTNVEIALRALCNWDPGHTADYLRETNGMYGATNNIRIVWLENMCRLNENAQIGELIAYAGPQYEFRTRVAAFQALSNLQFCNKAMVENLFNALISPNHRLSGPARNLLMQLKKTPANKAIIQAVYAEGTWSAWENSRIGAVKD